MNRLVKIALPVVLIAALASVAWAGPPRHYKRGRPAPDADVQLRLRYGLFQPDGESEFFDDVFTTFTGDIDDFEDGQWGVDVLLPVARKADLAFAVGHVDAGTRQAYRDFVDEFGGDIEHDTSLEMTPTTAALVLYPFGRGRSFTPYVGVGAGFWFWRYREVGDFIDFDVDPAEIVTTGFESDGIALGTFLLAGVDVPIADDWSFFADGRWTRVDDELDDDLEGFGTIDLSGRTFSAGFAFRF